MRLAPKQVLQHGVVLVFLGGDTSHNAFDNPDNHPPRKHSSQVDSQCIWYEFATLTLDESKLYASCALALCILAVHYPYN